jgi:acyl-CoA thioester hydrolase
MILARIAVFLFYLKMALPPALMNEQEMGRYYSEKNAFFKREIVFGDEISVSLKLRSVSKDFRKFSMQHEIFKNGSELAAILNVDGAWMHTRHRKIIIPPAVVINTLDHMEKTEDFVFA